MLNLLFHVSGASTISFILGVVIVRLTIPGDLTTSLLVGTCSSLFAAVHVAAQHGHLLVLSPIAMVWRWERRA